MFAVRALARVLSIGPVSEHDKEGTYSAISQCLGGSNASNGSNDGEGLHLEWNVGEAEGGRRCRARREM